VEARAGGTGGVRAREGSNGGEPAGSVGQASIAGDGTARVGSNGGEAAALAGVSLGAVGVVGRVGEAGGVATGESNGGSVAVKRRRLAANQLCAAASCTASMARCKMNLGRDGMGGHMTEATWPEVGMAAVALPCALTTSPVNWEGLAGSG
jgi:hypothetical protein